MWPCLYLPRSLATAAASSACSGGPVTVTTHTHFRHRGERGRALGWGPTAGCSALAPEGQPGPLPREGPALGPLWQRTARAHTHRSLSWPLSSGSCSPRSSSGNWQLRASSAGGPASSGGWVSAEGLRSPGKPRAFPPAPRESTTDLGAPRAASSAARCAGRAGRRSGPGRRRPC